MGDSIWDKETQIKRTYAEKYDACVDPDRRAAIAFSVLIDLHDEDESKFDILKPSGGVLIKDMPKRDT